MLGGLLQIRQCGFLPKTVIDVGAALGTFQLYEAFPDCKHFMIEPIAENEPYLAKLCHKLDNAEYLIAAATYENGTMTLRVDADLVHSHSSDAREAEQIAPTVEQRTIATVRLDHLCAERQLSPPYLIKIDVDGNELDVLKGTVGILSQTEYLVIESTLFGQIYDVIDFMRSHGFAMYDILDPGWRPNDRALWQVDLAFVKADSPYRSQKSYIPPAFEANLANHLEGFRQTCIQQIENYPDRQQIAEYPRWIAFPNWNQPEENLFATLSDLLRFVLTHPKRETLTLMIHTGHWSGEAANEAISSVLLYLMNEEGIEAADSTEILLAEPHIITPRLISQTAGRVSFAAEDQAAIHCYEADRLPAIPVTSPMTSPI